MKTPKHWQSGYINVSKARAWCQTPVPGAPRMQSSDFWELPVPRVKELETLLLYSRSYCAEFAHVSSKNYKAIMELSRWVCHESNPSQCQFVQSRKSRQLKCVFYLFLDETTKVAIWRMKECIPFAKAMKIFSLVLLIDWFILILDPQYIWNWYSCVMWGKG